jgi:nitroreductase
MPAVIKRPLDKPQARILEIIGGGDMMKENETIKIIKQRRSVRQFSKKQISEDHLQTVINAGLYAPSGGTNFEEDIYFTVIQDKSILHKINSLAKEMAQLSNRFSGSACLRPHSLAVLFFGF